MASIYQELVFVSKCIPRFIILYICMISSTTARLQSCAILRSNDISFRNKSLIIKDGSVFGNIREEYLTKDQIWNVSSIWRVSPSCELKSCTKEYLNGQCTTYIDGDVSPSETWLSAWCTCSRNCHCPRDLVKKLVCAHAYLQPGGCNICNAPYTELIQGSLDSFPTEWMHKVSSLIVKAGCTLTIYEEEDHEGESEVIYGPQSKEWTSAVGSYECECSINESIQPSQVPPPQSNLPVPNKVHIPNSLEEVVTMLSENNYDHPGLLAALSSLTHGRSSKNVYLLLIGSSGAGKSSAINILLRGQNITAAGDHISTTSDILEFRIPIPVPELGIENSEIRIIDTPGLADTRGLSKDASFLATLDDYLVNHEELKTRIPNLVLVFHTFADNRFHGDGARFVRMIRGLDSIRPKITDENFSNVLFVFSHLCSLKPDEQHNPLPRLEMFKNAVEMYSMFPKPILTVVVENKGADNDLFMRNGNYELPNKELYPQNLLDRFDMITMRGHDEIGNGVVNTNAIRNRSMPSHFTVRTIVHPMVNSSDNNKVAKYLNVLSSSAYNVATSEVSNLLAEAYESMDTSTKSKYPLALEELQRYLSLKNIKSKTDVPQTLTAILELLSGIEQNEAMSYLQEKGLNLKAPVFPTNTIVGSSFDILRNSLLSVSPFQLENRQSSKIGFMLPTVIRCKTIVPTNQKPINIFKIFDSKQNYFQHIIGSLLEEPLSSAANSTEIFTALSKKPKDGYFVKDMSCPDASDMHCFTATRFYKTFEFDLDASSGLEQLKPDFINRLQNLTPFNESSHDNVEQWNAFFNDFGTHVAKSAIGGGRIDMRFTLSNQVSVESAVAAVIKSLDFAEDPYGSVSRYKENAETVFAESGRFSHSLLFRGGSQEFHVSDIFKLTLEKAFGTLKNWKRSIQYYPAVFPEKIVPIHQIIEEHLPESQRAEISEKIQTAFIRLLSSTLKYVAPTPDPKILEELERKRKETEEKLKQLELEKQRKAEETEKQRLAALEAQRKLEEEERERRHRLEEEAAAQRRRQEEELRRLQRVEEERLRRQREEEARIHREYLRRVEAERIREQEHREWVWREQQRIWAEEERRRRRSSCLKKGTRILMADYTEKPVELLEIGDILLDKDLQPTHVLGISYEFLLSQKFYGFDNKTFFFTDTHLFAGANNADDHASLLFYTTSTANLFAQNPLLKYLNITEFGNTSGESTQLLYYDHDSNVSGNRIPNQKEVTVFQEMNNYPIDTPIFFIQVDSPSGTYFAEGFLCRHEIPPLAYWPNTMSALISLFGTNGFEIVGEMPYSIKTIHFIDKLSHNVQNAVFNVLQRAFSSSSAAHISPQSPANKDCDKLSLDNFDLDEVIGKIFGNPSMAALAMEIYGGSGSIISQYLDNPLNNLSNNNCLVQDIQNLLLQTIRDEIELTLNSQNFKHNQ